MADFIPPIALSYLKTPVPAASLNWMLELVAEDVGSLPLEGWPGVAHVSMTGGRQRVTLSEGVQPRELLKQIVDRGLAIDTFERASASLDEIFITVVKGPVEHAQ